MLSSRVWGFVNCYRLNSVKQCKKMLIFKICFSAFVMILLTSGYLSVTLPVHRLLRIWIIIVTAMLRLYLHLFLNHLTVWLVEYLFTYLKKFKWKTVISLTGCRRLCSWIPVASGWSVNSRESSLKESWNVWHDRISQGLIRPWKGYPPLRAVRVFRPQVVTNRDTLETLLCIAYVFEVSTSEHGAQHHIYRLVKDWRRHPAGT